MNNKVRSDKLNFPSKERILELFDSGVKVWRIADKTKASRSFILDILLENRNFDAAKEKDKSLKRSLLKESNCRFCNKEFSTIYARNGHEVAGCDLNPNRYKIPPHSDQISEEIREKISKGLIRYLKDNPDKVPYRLYHSSKESYPEKYFREMFQQLRLDFEPQYPVQSYNLDFAFLNNKIDVEIDGELHYSDPKVVKRDIRRNLYLSNLGWKIIRIRWSEYKKLDLKAKEAFIKELKDCCNLKSDKEIEYENLFGWRRCS